MKQPKHIGSLIKQISKIKKISVKEFADRLHYCNSNVYDIFRRQSINSDLLRKISKILDYDFSLPQERSNKSITVLAVIKTNVSKFEELLKDSSLEIIMSKQVDSF